MITIKNISMHYGPTVALNDVSFSVNKGNILGLLGPNGAGKSTLMKILTTYIYPSGGTAELEGFDILDNPLKVRENVGYLPENVPLYMDMRVDEYLMFVGRARGIKGTLLEQRFKWIRESCGIGSVWKHGMSELSKGYKQRVGLAQALIHDPKILILDEPTSGLDPLQIIGIRRLVKELAKDKTIIFSTHILKEVEVLADQIVIINEGKIVSQGTRDELAEDAMKKRCHQLTVKEEKASVERALSGLRSASDIIYTGEDSDGFVTFEIRSSFQSNDLWKEINSIIQENNWSIKNLNERTFDLEDMFIALLSKDKKTKNS